MVWPPPKLAEAPAANGCGTIALALPGTEASAPEGTGDGEVPEEEDAFRR
jgi:hypothetical protein